MTFVNSQLPPANSQRVWPALLGIWVLGVGICIEAQSLSREEALAQVYPGAEIRAEQIFLTPVQMTEVAKRAGTDPTSALVARYVAARDGQVIGRAYVDTHVVRTKRESLLISLDAHRRVMRVDVTAFLEPAEFRAPGPWLGQYRGRAMDDDLAINRAIRPIAGATLTARAANNAVRRVLAVDEVLQAAGGAR
jgi:electron transport complex protein RnfG